MRGRTPRRRTSLAGRLIKLRRLPPIPPFFSVAQLTRRRVNALDNQEHNRFQVELRGLIDLLSQHLYSGPSVFVRELLQNAVDAIQARRQLDPHHAGTIEIEVIPSASGPSTIMFQDNGVGLTEDEVHRFLATIGQSSKRGNFNDRPDDFLGKFGIGLLSCFTVTDQITVLTRSARDGDHPGLEWRGNTEGTYSVRKLTQEIPLGTQVFLRAADGFEEYYEPTRLLALARDYGSYLSPRITLSSGGRSDGVNSTPPWTENPNESLSRQRLLEYGRAAFDRDFLDVIPLNSPSGGVEGVAFVLAEPVHAGSRQQHRVYLKDMLLSTKTHDLLPEWAFFAQCVVNSSRLRPTASRESFYDDGVLDQTREELGSCLRQYLVDMARMQPQRFDQLMNVHHLAVKALAVDDDECLELFADWLPFETSLGRMTLGEYCRNNPVIRYVPTCDQFRQIAQVAASESLAVVNAGYVYDVEILQRIGALRSDLRVEVFEADQLSDRFEPLTREEREETIEFERLCDVTLQRFKCMVEIAKFRPTDLPALYVADDNSNFVRSVEQAQDVSDDMWSGVLGNIASDVSSVYARLYLNYSNSLVRRICGLNSRQGQERCIEMIYVQALLLGHFPLKQIEVQLLNKGLLGLIDWALDAGADNE
ncbi:HSP90 family protein [Blastopirellula marina]|uniref:HSP90 family protein n=1 Tax=Blastopirellula marina TaxID=124 RepID=A0A2S8G695_9BACT|nr:HSP90 family protein [Blastopirellula marina]PQO43723.1 HSP90 family protein [Blastopirellula marina]PTL45353.1 HSP90 family protein [Blastopirellula marina]